MKVLVVGGGGREHALVWKIAQSPQVTKVYCAPGNAGIAKVAECVPITTSEIERLVTLVRDQKIELTVVGPEDPLVRGIVDRFQEEGLTIFGVRAGAARLEGSKAFAKRLMQKYGLPTASFETFTDPEPARKYIRRAGAPIVVKADGLAAGKGVFPCTSLEEALEAVDEIMVKRAFGVAGEKVVIEEYLEGEEASFLAITDGKTVVPFPSSQDHKAIYDGDKGSNTGGMGAYSPAPVVTTEIHGQVMDRIMLPTVEAMAKEGCPFQGILYAGLMVAEGTAKVLEFNVRLGDPEAQPLLMRLKGDLVPILEAAVRGRLDEISVEWDERATVCVVMASKGYPGSYDKGHVISGFNEVDDMTDVVIFHAGTAEKEGQIVTSGGRVLGVTARGKDIAGAIQTAYSAVEKIHWDGAHFRKDIGRKALHRKGEKNQ